MKKIILIVATILLTVACSKDENEPTVPNPLIGTWEWVDTLDYGDGNIHITTLTHTYNSNWTFNHSQLEELNGSVDKQESVSGTYSIQDKDKVKWTVIAIIEQSVILPFRKGQDEKGEYLIYVFDIFGDSDKYYKK